MLKKAVTVGIKKEKKSRPGIKTVTFFVIIVTNTVILLNGTLNRRKSKKPVIITVNNRITVFS